MRIFFDYAMYNMGTISVQKSENTAINLVEISNSAKVFPNPVNDKLHITSQVEFESYSIKTITGQTVFQGELNSSQTIDTQNLKRGNYLITLIFSDFATTKKLIKL